MSLLPYATGHRKSQGQPRIKAEGGGVEIDLAFDGRGCKVTLQRGEHNRIGGICDYYSQCYYLPSAHCYLHVHHVQKK